MSQYQPFVLFGQSHEIVLALTVLVPVMLAILVRTNASRGLARAICCSFAVAIAGIWAIWYIVAYRNGWLTIGDALPMDLCSWAAVATVITLLRPNQFTYELAYFWALAGTVQGLLTPDTPYDFPEIRFLVFSIFHGGIIASVLFLTLGMKLRPYLESIPRVIGWTLFYALLAGFVDWMYGVNYGFLRAKPSHASLYDLMPSWPYYIAVVVALGVLSTLIYYLPFFLADRLRALRK